MAMHVELTWYSPDVAVIWVHKSSVVESSSLLPGLKSHWQLSLSKGCGYQSVCFLNQYQRQAELFKNLELTHLLLEPGAPCTLTSIPSPIATYSTRQQQQQQQLKTGIP